MEKVENGVFVSLHYKGTLQDGDVFDTSKGRDPLEVQMGAGQVIPGLEKALMHVDKSLTHSFARSDVPSEMNAEVGQVVALTSPEGQQVPAQIIEVNDEKVVVDLNHPLAGETLTFDIEVVGISSAPTQDHTGCGNGCACSS
jgi:peptidylprolyl isomerase